MNINEFQNLPQADQLAQAGRIAGVDPTVFDGIWRTESGRGEAMLSPAGAEGHFGLMPGTRKVWEGRFGSAIDPNNFGQSLFTAAHTLKENLGRFKNLPDALRAYNGGWDPAKWGNPETAAYAGKVLGYDTAPATVPGSTAQAVATVSMPTAADLWDKPSEGLVPRKTGKPDLSGTIAALSSREAPEIAKPAAPTFNAIQKQGQNEYDSGMATLNKADNTPVYDVLKAGTHLATVNQLVIAAMRDKYEPVEGYAPKDEDLKGYSEGHMRELRSAKSPQEFNAIKFDIDYDKEQSNVLFSKGTIGGLGAALVGDLPFALVSGIGASLGMASLGAGSLALARNGQRLSAVASSIAEGVVGNLSGTLALDIAGKHQGAADYGMSMGMGLLNPLFEFRAIGRGAAAFQEAAEGIRVIEQAAAKKKDLLERATANLGKDADEATILKEMDRLDAEGVRVQFHSSTATIPEHRKMNVGEDLSEETPKVPEAVAKSDSADNGWTSISADNPRADIADAAEARAAYGHNVAGQWELKEMDGLRLDLARNDPDWQRSISRATEGKGWDAVEKMPNGIHRSEGIERLAASNKDVAEALHAAEALVREYLPNSKVLFTAKVNSANSGAEVTSVGRTHIIGLNEHGTPADALHNLQHEIGHAIYHQNAPKASPRVLKMIDEDWLDFVNTVRKGGPEAWEQRNGVTSPFHTSRMGGSRPAENTYNLSRDEFMAEQFTRHIQNRMMRGDYGNLDKTTQETILDAVRKVFQYVKDLFTGDQVKSSKGAEEFFGEVLRQAHMKSAKDAERAELRAMLASKGVVVEPTAASRNPTGPADELLMQNDPISRKYGLDLLPMGTPAEKAEAKQIIALYTKADAWAAANPINEKRLNKILSRFDQFDPLSNQMLRSENPLVRMVASELLENGGGAAGRQSSAAIAKYMHERAIIGNVIGELDGHFGLWLKARNGDRVKEFMTGTRRAEFNRLIAEEVEQRRYPNAHVDYGQDVRNAADAVEGSFERARMLQVDAKTIGWGALPESSRGYMPHRMSSEKVRAMTNQQRRVLHDALTDQFVTISGFDMSFADTLASKYIDRVAHRALGGFDAPIGLHQTGAHEVVKEALDQMGMNRAEVDAMMKRYMKGGAGHTKKRLDLDLRREYPMEEGQTFRLMDLMDTDMLNLVRGQSQRVSGEAALARHGIMGKPGLSILRRGMSVPGGKGTAKEMEAFDAACAEFLGSPFGTQSKWVDRAMQTNSVLSLGGMGFNQLGETINAITTLGLKRGFAAVSDAGKMRSEVLALVNGRRVENPWLQSIERAGGAEFGTDAYKMVFPMDLPDAPINTMGHDTLSAADRLLRGAGHLQSKLSLWKMVHSTQQRAVAQEIVRAFADALHAGRTDVTLADMGLTADVLERLRADSAHILQRDASGKLVGFDITMASDKDAANQLVQAVHRGAGQIIQGTFIGETGKYVHNSYLKMLAQFRGFSLTAVDKQWNRQASNHGVATALGILVGSMGAAAPIYIARTYAASIGRKDQHEYLEKQLAWSQIARATTNYVALSGFAGDFADALSSVSGVGKPTGGRTSTNTQLVGNLVAPVLGKVDKVWGAVQNTKDGTDVHGLIKEVAPMGRLPWLIPAINALD